MTHEAAPCCALVLPGLSHRRANEDRDIAAEALLAASGAGFRRAASPALRLPGAVGLAAEAGLRIDIAEITWFDLKSGEPTGLLARLGEGFALLWYWLLSPAAWLAVGVGRTAAAGLALAALGLALWFLSILAVGLEGLLKVLPAILPGLVLPGWLAGASAAAAALGGLMLLLLASVSGAGGFEALPRVTRDWLANGGGPGIGLRQRLRVRVLGRIEEARDAGYGRIVIIAHSIGAALLVDALAAATRLDDVDAVTLGAPVAFLAAREPSLGRSLARLMEQPPRAWLDLHAPTDYLAGPVPGHRRRYGDAASRAMGFSQASRLDRWLLRTHGLYWRDDEAVALIAAQVLASARAGRVGSAHA